MGKYVHFILEMDSILNCNIYSHYRSFWKMLNESAKISTVFAVVYRSIVLPVCQLISGTIAELLGKACSRRGAILRAVFKLMDRTGPQVQLSLCRLILAVSSSAPCPDHIS